MATQPYDGLAGSYDNNRASYPQELIARFRDLCPLPEGGGLVIDVGAGTGIAARQLRAAFPAEVAVIGIEPGDDMRRTAVARTIDLANIAFLNSPAEALPFGDAAVNAVFVAQALHWFDRPRFYNEAARVLHPGGTLGLIENNRNWSDSPFLADYETLLEHFGDHYSRSYRRFDIASELTAASGLDFERRLSSSHVLKIPRASFIDWSFTSTKMQACIANAGEQQMRDLLTTLVERYFAAESAVSILYETELLIARRV